MTTFKTQVKSGQGNQSLLSYLKSALTDYPSVKSLKRAIDGKKCKINGRVEYFSTHQVKVGDEIEITLLEKVPLKSAEILYEDEELIIFNKPAGKTSESFEGYHLVHRLDKETSGVFVLAKTKRAADHIMSQFKNRKIKKEYLALCDGKIEQEKWVINNYLGKKIQYQGGVIFGSCSKDNGKRATTHFERLETRDDASYVLVKPVTGVTHQIRVHLKEMGHPVIGDWQYAQKFECPIDTSRQMLHAQKITMIHPVTDQQLSIEAPLPEDFLQVQKSLFGA